MNHRPQGEGRSQRVSFPMEDSQWETVAITVTPEYAATVPAGASGATGAGWNQGNPQRTFPGMQVGRAQALPTIRGAQVTQRAFFAADVILAELDKDNKRVFVLERLGKRLAHATPWMVGQNITLLPPVKGPKIGWVLRGASIGKGMLNDHYFISVADTPKGGGPPIILHHRAPNSPINSTKAYDPDGNGIEALLSDVLYIDSALPRQQWCQKGATATKLAPEYWVYINGTKHGDGSNPRTSGWIPVHFEGVNAVMSGEVYGPLTWLTQRHQLGIDFLGRALRGGGLNADSPITRHSDFFEAPAEWLDQEEPDVQEPSGHPVRVWCMVDNDVMHPWICGPRKGLRRWHTKNPVQETPPCTPSKPVDGAPMLALPQAYMVGGPLSTGITFIPPPKP